MISWMLSNPEIGWAAVLLYLMWEIRGPRGRVKEIMSALNSLTVVVRALARASNKVDTKEVDTFLTDNGNEPSDFLDDEEEESLSVNE